MHTGQRLFDPRSRAAVRAETDRPHAVAFALTAVVIAGLVGGLHHEELPFLAYAFEFCPPQAPRQACSYPAALDWLAAAATLLATGVALTVAFRLRRVVPTVTCRRCERRGWIVDLETTAGHCPHCGSDRFRYRALQGVGVPVVRILDLDDVEGSRLVELKRDEGRL